MAGSKHKKKHTACAYNGLQVKKEPTARDFYTKKQPTSIAQPESYLSENPSWNFSFRDTAHWAFSSEHVGMDIWDEIIPKLEDFESMTWSDILIAAKKQNHSISVSDLHADAQKYLAQRRVESESIVSLRLGGRKRIYGMLIGSTFNIIWYDEEHGDNSRCVCRSKKEHT